MGSPCCSPCSYNEHEVFHTVKIVSKRTQTQICMCGEEYRVRGSLTQVFFQIPLCTWIMSQWKTHIFRTRLQVTWLEFTSLPPRIMLPGAIAIYFFFFSTLHVLCISAMNFLLNDTPEPHFNALITFLFLQSHSCLCHAKHNNFSNFPILIWPKTTLML